MEVLFEGFLLSFPFPQVEMPKDELQEFIDNTFGHLVYSTTKQKCSLRGGWFGDDLDKPNEYDKLNLMIDGKFSIQEINEYSKVIQKAYYQIFMGYKTCASDEVSFNGFDVALPVPQVKPKDDDWYEFLYHPIKNFVNDGLGHDCKYNCFGAGFCYDEALEVGYIQLMVEGKLNLQELNESSIAILKMYYDCYMNEPFECNCEVKAATPSTQNKYVAKLFDAIDTLKSLYESNQDLARASIKEHIGVDNIQSINDIDSLILYGINDLESIIGYIESKPFRKYDVFKKYDDDTIAFTIEIDKTPHVCILSKYRDYVELSTSMGSYIVTNGYNLPITETYDIIESPSQKACDILANGVNVKVYETNNVEDARHFTNCDKKIEGDVFIKDGFDGVRFIGYEIDCNFWRDIRKQIYSMIDKF